ncbi:MAG: flavodoxin-dependent (E)-4-hydroxy-3-methylbut-2-enyl-diphosphate synthase, partial [candidate division KSB1 bacterium]|nr:flavodoxin-dependent (E)-4-hydroxy-3-methylbut-2-enyl-diphosphate synthase [candidate division KSB1 bacterium]
EMLAAKTDYPLHLGVTAAGTYGIGLIKSAIALGTLLRQGIGDTIRVSLSAEPVLEVRAALDILRTLGLNSAGLNLVSCPGCGRQQINLLPIIQNFEAQMVSVRKPITVAIMGCAVNGPGEAREADIGVACGRGKAVLFRRGVACRTITPDRIVAELVAAVAEIDCA